MPVELIPLTFQYRNYRGEVSTRRVVPIACYFGTTEWHPAPQWLLQAHDLDRGAQRDFAMADMMGSPTASAPAEPVVPVGWTRHEPGDIACMAALPAAEVKVWVMDRQGERHYGRVDDFDFTAWDRIQAHHEIIAWKLYESPIS